MKRVLYLTGSRADFGLMHSTLHQIAAHPALALSLAVTGMHLSPAYGETVHEVEQSGLDIVATIPVDIENRSAAGMARALAQTLDGMTDALAQAQPDVLLLLGDRGEMLAGALAALHLGITVAHLHGGERSGTVDEPMRHAISKLAHWHFVSTQESRERLIRMGERAEHIWVTGAPSLDDLPRLPISDAEETARALGLDPARPYLMVLFHPVVQQAADAASQSGALIDGLHMALSEQSEPLQVLWLAPNSDAGSRAIVDAVQNAGLPGWRWLTHAPRARYLAALRHSLALVGNSSSGIIEAASFGTPVLNIGLRQHQRERNANTLDCDTDAQAIATGLRQQLSHGRFKAANVYGDGRAGERITTLLAAQPLDANLLLKSNSY